MEQGVAAGVLLSFETPVPTLDPVGTATELALELSGADGQAGELVWYREDLQGDGGGGTWPFTSHATAAGERVDLCRLVDTEIVFREQPFRRGDANADGRYDISDAVHLLEHLFDFARPVERTCAAGLRPRYDAGELDGASCGSCP